MLKFISNIMSGSNSEDRPSSGDTDFVSEVTDDITCSICLSVLCEPNLTDCCGNHFCQACIGRIKKDGRPCPLCQEANFTTMLNKSLSRKLKQLEVKCPNTKSGCSWIGELGGVDRHVNDRCDFFEVLCDFGCGERIARYCIAEHKSGTCKMRPVACAYCQLRDTWAVITQDHYPVCEKHPVLCPNECNIGAIERKQLEQHLSACPLQVINCTFQFAGCKVSLPRHEMQQHVAGNMASHLTLGFQTFENMASHFTLGFQTLHQQLVAKDDEITKLKAITESQQAELVSLKQTVNRQAIVTVLQQGDINRLQAVIPLELTAEEYDHRKYPPFHVTMTNFEHHRNSDTQWFSEPFYTHKRGYKMCLSVFANGTGNARYSYVSVYANLMRGEFDDELVWPFQGYVNVVLDLHGNRIEGLALGHHEKQLTEWSGEIAECLARGFLDSFLILSLLGQMKYI